MIKRLQTEIAALREQNAQKNEELRRREIVEQIERCERQFIRPKRPKKETRRRQTWAPGSVNPSSQEDPPESDDNRNLLPPTTPAIFNVNRGSEFNMSIDDVEFVSADEAMFETSPHKVHTPVIFKRRLSTVNELDSAILSGNTDCPK